MDISIRAAAVRLDARLGDVDWNLEQCERLVERAAGEGATWIALPEFFSSGIAFKPELGEAAAPPDGAPAELLSDLARRHGAHVGGSFLARDADGHVRNAFLLADPSGRIVGRHNKDLPTMWENAVYVGGADPGLIEAGEVTIGVALCWELMRTQTVERLRGRVDLIVAGSGWWSIPTVAPRSLTRRLEARNERRAVMAPLRFAPYVGAPVVHGAHCGSVNCRWPGIPAIYHGHFEGGASVADHAGRPLALRRRDEGAGIAVANVELRRGDGRRPA
jgi:predicted amidohydrolase